MLYGQGLGLAQAPVVPPLTLSGFTGSPDTLQLMREQSWGDRGERSFAVRQMVEEITRDVQPKDYLSEILCIRNFCADHLRYINDPLHVELVKDPARLVEEIRTYGVAQADCDEIAELIGTFALQLGREAEFVVVGFGAPGDFSHVFARVKEPKTQKWIVCDPVAGTDEMSMLERVTDFQLWSLDEL